MFLPGSRGRSLCESQWQSMAITATRRRPKSSLATAGAYGKMAYSMMRVTFISQAEEKYDQKRRHPCFPRGNEVVLRAHADVAEVAVVACRHPEWGESVKALVIPKPGAVVEPDDIIQYCKDLLAPIRRRK